MCHHRGCDDRETEGLMSVASSPERVKANDNHPLLIAASCVALATLVPVVLYQLDVISELPDPPFSIFDSEQITMSKPRIRWAFQTGCWAWQVLEQH